MIADQHITDIYDYTDEQGVVRHQTIRYEPKKFRQRRRPMPGEESSEIDKDGWIWKLSGGDGVSVRLYPYRLPELRARKLEPIYLVEGEKDANNLATLGLLTTTLPMGAGKWRAEFGKWFRGRRVVIIADHDKPNEKGERIGLLGAEKLASELLDIAADVRIIPLPKLWPKAAEGQDISDWLAVQRDHGCYDEELKELLQNLAREDSTKMPLATVLDGIVGLSPRGGLTVVEELLARRLVAWAGLMFCGGRFWQYQPKAGAWSICASKGIVEGMIRRALTEAGGLELITASRVASIMKLMESVHVRQPNELNAAPDWYMLCKNGVLDSKSFELLEFAPEYYLTNQLPVNYRPGAQCPQWVEWISGRHDDAETIDQIQEMFGYCLARDLQMHVFFMLFGDGGTGKSTCVSVLEALIGEQNRVSIQLEELSNPFMRSRLVGKQLYLCKELTDKSFTHIGLIKAIVSGDVIDVDIKHGQGFDFKPYGRMVMESNVVAMTPDSSGGFARRFVQIDFDKVVPRNQQNIKLTSELCNELDGIFTWALAGVKRLRQRGYFHLTERSEQARKEVMKHRGQVKSFIESGWVIIDPEEEGGMSTIMLHDIYLEWCEAADVVPFYREKDKFLRELMSKSPEFRARKQRVRGAEGVRYWLVHGVKYTNKRDEGIID